MNEENKKHALNRIAERAVPEDLDLWEEIHPLVGTAAAPRSSRSGRALAGSGSNRRFLVGLAASLLLALAVGGTFPLWNHPEPASAEAILDRAQSAADGALGVKSYHLRMERQVVGKGNQTISSEVWFGGSDLQRTSGQTKDSNGATVSISDVVFNGAQTWIASTENGQTRVIHTTGTAWNKPADDPSRENSLADLLAKYSSDKNCMTAQLQGEGTVAGQAAYLISATPRSGGCVVDPGPTPGARVIIVPKGDQVDGSGKGAQPQDGGKVVQGSGVGQMLVWVDKQSFLPLKTEVRDLSGVLLDRSEVTSVQYNLDIPGSTFFYTPPAGATVSEFTGGTGADVKRQLFGDPAGKSQPAKKP